ncbi:MAG: PAS domain S-box protein [Gemmatimonadota bacterium]
MKTSHPAPFPAAEGGAVDLEGALLELASIPGDPDASIEASVSLAHRTLSLNRIALWIGRPDADGLLCRVNLPADVEPLAAERRGRGRGESARADTRTIHVPVGSALRSAGVLACEANVGRDWTEGERLFAFAVAQAIATQLERGRRQEAEDAAGELAFRADQVEQMAGFGSWLWQLDSGVVTTSNGFAAMAGLDGGTELPFEEFLAFVHPDDRPEVVETLASALRGERTFAFEARSTRADGTSGWMLARGHVDRDAAGSPVRVFGATREITELRSTQEALRGSESRFRELFAHFPFSVQIFDTDGRTLQVNEEFERFWGYGIEALGSFSPLTDPQLEPIRDLIRRGFDGEMVFLPPVLFDGSRITADRDVPGARWVQAFMFPVRDAGGKLREVILVRQDVTQQQSAEAQLKVSEESYRTIFDLASDGIFVHDPVTGDVLDVNRKACEIHGLELSNLIEGGLDAIAGPPGSETQSAAIDFIHRAAAGEPQRFEWLVKNAPKPVWCEISLNRVSILGEDRVLANVRVIHERKMAEEALRRAYEELEERVAERTTELQNANDALSRSVAEHKAARDELTRRTEELEGIFRTLPDLYFRLDADGTIRQHRTGAGQGLYLPPERFLGRRITDIMPPDAANLIGAGLHEVASTGRLAVVEYPLTIDGVTFENEARLLPMPDGSLISIVRDITARKNAERTLQEREEHFRKLIENAHDMVVILDARGRMTYGSPSVKRILGYDPEGLKDQDTLEFVHPADARAVLQGLEKLAAEPGVPALIECRFRHNDRSWRYVEAVGSPLVPDSAEGGFVFNVRDVTERHAAEDALREREEHFRTLIENAHDITCICDEQGMMLYQSPSLERRLGYTPEEMIGRVGFPYIHPDDAPVAQERLARIVASPGTVLRLEYRFRHKDGTWRMLEAFGRTLLPHSASGGVVLNIRDTTERMLAERALEKARVEAENAREAAESANRAKSEFLSRMSHELRTPMNSILGFAQLLDRAEIPVEQRRGVGHILKAGRHLLQLINEVLEISRIEAGRQNFSLEPVRVRGAMLEAVSLVRPLAAQRGVELDDGPWANGDRFVQADRQRLVQVLLNLLSNAVKYNRQGGRVRLTCSAPDPESGGRIRIRIEDSGRGIPAERREELFTPFSRLGAEQSEVEGTGLGLALSQRLTEAMGGVLELESSGPGGSVFRLELLPAGDPVMSLEESSTSAHPIGEVEHAEATLLYVEDNLANLSLVESILLSRPKWRTIPALQGQLGVELAREHSPDLILLDLHLPDISGEEVLRRLRSDARTSKIPIVVISADATRVSRERLERAGADGYLPKPLDVDEFLATLERFLPRAQK